MSADLRLRASARRAAAGGDPSRAAAEPAENGANEDAEPATPPPEPPPAAAPTAQPSLWLAYLLWLGGGTFGAHLFYLGRPLQGFLYLVSAGGFFLGALTDATRIHSYVRQATATRPEQWRAEGLHESSWRRFVGQLSFGWLFGHLLSHVYSAELTPVPVRVALQAMGEALGAYLVGIAGRPVTASFARPFAVFLLARGVEAALLGPRAAERFILLSFLADRYAIKLFEQSVAWDTRRPRVRGCCRVAVTVAAGWLLFSAVLLSALYHNAELENTAGEKVPLRDLLGGPQLRALFSEFERALRILLAQLQSGRFERPFSGGLDVEGEGRALTLLGLQPGASLSEVRRAHRELALVHHPDKQTSPEAREAAEARMAELNWAYETLVRILRRRGKA